MSMPTTVPVSMTVPFVLADRVVGDKPDHHHKHQNRNLYSHGHVLRVVLPLAVSLVGAWSRSVSVVVAVVVVMVLDAVPVGLVDHMGDCLGVGGLCGPKSGWVLLLEVEQVVQEVVAHCCL